MTPLLIALMLVQAAFLLWASIRLGDVFLQRDKRTQLAWFVGTVALPLAIAWWGRNNDPERVLCGLGDCVALAVSVAFVRYWAVDKEMEQLQLEQQFAGQAAADRRAAARRAYEAERVQAATAALELGKEKAALKTKTALPEKQVTPPLPRPPSRGTK